MQISLLVMVDSSDKENYRVSQETILPFLGHFGIPHRVIDLTQEKRPSFDVSGILIAQEKLGVRIPKETKGFLYQAVKERVGLINLDHHLNYWKELVNLLQIEKIGTMDRTSLLKLGEAHYINQLQESESEKRLLQPSEFLKVTSINNPLLLSEDGAPLLLVSSSVRLVQFLISPKLWQRECLGYCGGLDDILSRSIIWAVKKPFVMMAMPPFVTAKIDDASGSGSIFGKKKDSANKNFAYIDTFNKYGYIPNIGLYIDEITNEDGRIIKEKYDKDLAEFSPHAFSDPKNINEFPIYMHHNGEEFSSEELKDNFARVDKKFHDWGIKPSKTINAHFGEIGLNALPYLKERGQVYDGVPAIRFGKTWVDKKARNWHPKPYGYHGFILDYMPDDPDFFGICAHAEPGIKDYLAPHFDFLCGCTPFWNENPKIDVQKAAMRGAKQIKSGLDGGFFGCLLAHEQRIATLSIGEWEEILKNIDKLTSRYRSISKGYDYIAEYAKTRYDTKIMEANYNPASKEIKLKLIGKSALPLEVYLFVDESCEYEFKEIPVFEGEKEIVLK